MNELIEQLRLKIQNCNDNLREDRARKGAYVDCLTMIEELSLLIQSYPDTDADGYVFCGKCGKMK